MARDPDPVEVGAAIDWSGWYLFEEDDVGQSPEQDDVVNEFASALCEQEAQRAERLRQRLRALGIDPDEG